MQVLVIGAGVVGLAVARACALAGHEVIVAERERGIGSGISSRNSEVIHGGMYYPTDSLRARHCTRGRRMLYEYCASHGVPHRRCGKLIVATNDAERAKIESIRQQGLINGVEDLTLIEGAEAKRLEPALACIAAVLSPHTGTVDSHSLMLALQGDLEDRGGMIAFGTPITRITRTPDGWEVAFGSGGDEPFTVDAVINSAGLHATTIAAAVEGYPRDLLPRLVMAKGNYFAYSGKPVFTHLIYPAPVDGGLGIHVTLDMAGRMKFGPDVEWIDEERYEVDAARADNFYERIRTYWPGLSDNSLTPDYSGIRPKLSGPGEPPVDFIIDGPKRHGLPNLVNLFGIESPGLTSSLSIAEDVVGMLE